nr:MAG TPA: hypothetical protein [Caudoviricetes sp.]
MPRSCIGTLARASLAKWVWCPLVTEAGVWTTGGHGGGFKMHYFKQNFLEILAKPNIFKLSYCYKPQVPPTP